ncbi:MAG TPA: FmdB family zinc ribbon protein [Acidimicrobiales bacterium]
MPTYEYRCKACGEQLEVVQSFSDDPLTECPSCGGALRKVFGSIGISFKGSGFYKTDSRASSSAGSAASSNGSSNGSDSSSSSSSSESSSSASSSGSGSGSGGSQAKSA